MESSSIQLFIVCVEAQMDGWTLGGGGWRMSSEFIPAAEQSFILLGGGGGILYLCLIVVPVSTIYSERITVRYNTQVYCQVKYQSTMEDSSSERITLTTSLIQMCPDAEVTSCFISLSLHWLGK